MSEFNFKSQIATSREQSERLLALGLKKETADMHLQSTLNDVWSPYIPIAMPYSKVEAFNLSKDVFRTIPAWSLHRLLCMLPDDAPKIFWILDGASITIDVENDCNTFFPHKGDIYKSVVDCIEWLIEEGYFNKEYLCEKVVEPQEITLETSRGVSAKNACCQ